MSEQYDTSALWGTDIMILFLRAMEVIGGRRIQRTLR